MSIGAYTLKHNIPKVNNAELTLFVDDTAVIVQSEFALLSTRYLQRAITSLEKWCHKWKIKLNDTKYQTVLYTRKRKQTN